MTSLPEMTYDAPYVHRRLWWQFWKPVYRIPEETDMDRVRLHELSLFIIAWCRSNGLVTMVPTDTTSVTLIPQITNNVASFASLIYSTNMRNMVKRDELDTFIAQMADTMSSTVMTDIQQLCISTCASFEPYLVNLVINKTYNAFSIFPVPDADISWEDIHEEYPFFWMVLFIHLTIHRYTDKERTLQG